MEQVVAALRAEAGRLYERVSGLPEGEWERPTLCAPWTVREVLAHVTLAVEQLDRMLQEPEPRGPALPSPFGCHGAGGHCSPAVSAAREDAVERAAGAFSSGQELADHFDAAWRAAITRCDGQSTGRLVSTRLGEAVRREDCLTATVVEVCVHGLDVAHGLDHEPWSTDEAAELVAGLLLGNTGAPYVPVLGWDRMTFLRKGTGRLPLSPSERSALGRRGVPVLVLS
ncbi:maleylpyruvate isomerase family mycothiol-dependent enzyme [Streptomyces sp. NPDC006879]|uniref:maleylpyruvate isomerase family mycothiol-dependent enzyme n=1 Tax=Streptomyces sp. NPDC006879 TaxID=3364767 RepID=UPI0036CE7882